MARRPICQTSPKGYIYPPQNLAHPGSLVLSLLSSQWFSLKNLPSLPRSTPRCDPLPASLLGVCRWSACPTTLMRSWRYNYGWFRPLSVPNVRWQPRSHCWLFRKPAEASRYLLTIIMRVLDATKSTPRSLQSWYLEKHLDPVPLVDNYVPSLFAQKLSKRLIDRHLGITRLVSTSGSLRISGRCSAGRSAFFALNSVGARFGCLHPITSHKLYSTLCLPIMLYGSELWSLTKSDLNMLERTHRNAQFRVSQPDAPRSPSLVL